MYVSIGHPGSRPDKTIVKTDEFVQAVRGKKILYDDVEFLLYRIDGSSFKVRGAWIISDNGYAKWRMLQCPIKSSSSIDEMKWSTRLESVRKDVETFFGRLKIRFRILRSRIGFHDKKQIDKIFLACCIMHNMLLKDDGLDVGWDNHEDEDDDDLRNGLELRRIRLRVLEPQHLQQIGAELRQVNSTATLDNDDEVEQTHYALRSQLIEHYKYCKEHNLVEWLTHRK